MLELNTIQYHLSNDLASSEAACFKTLAEIESGTFVFSMSNLFNLFYFLWQKNNLLQGCAFLPMHMGDWLFLYCIWDS